MSYDFFFFTWIRCFDMSYDNNVLYNSLRIIVLRQDEECWHYLVVNILNYDSVEHEHRPLLRVFNEIWKVLNPT